MAVSFLLAMINHGINLNFTASGVDIPSQLRELRKYRFKYVRLNIIRYNTSQTAINNWRSYARYALDIGFEKVIWGFGAGSNLTASNFNDYANGILEQAEWFQQQNDPRLEFQIGNEEELHHDDSLPNGPLRANLRSLATNVQSVYTVGLISYSSSIFTGNEIGAWKNEGLGGLDRIGFNLYGSDTVFKNSAVSIAAYFGDAGFVSEWGTNNGYQDFNDEYLYARTVANRREVLDQAGIKEAYYYNFMESNNRWGIKSYPISGNFRAAWPQVLGVRPWFVGNPNEEHVRPNVPDRPKNEPRPTTTSRPHYF